MLRRLSVLREDERTENVLLALVLTAQTRCTNIYTNPTHKCVIIAARIDYRGGSLLTAQYKHLALAQKGDELRKTSPKSKTRCNAYSLRFNLVALEVDLALTSAAPASS